MSLRIAVAAPFRQAGTTRLRENEVVVALSLDRDWMTPDQAARLVDIATGQGLLERDGEELVATFDPGEITIPEGFTPDERLFQEREPFERLLDRIVDGGHEKRTAVASINEIQDELGLTIEAAAVAYARRNDIAVGPAAGAARRELGE
ncbi:MAG: DUF2240 family protein [Halobacteriaceae archaeon]